MKLHLMVQIHYTGDAAQWQRSPCAICAVCPLNFCGLGAQSQSAYSQYMLGKVFLSEHNAERGMAYMELAAENGSECARLFLNRRDSLTEPQLMLAATRLLYHMGRIFQDNSLPQTGAVQHIDRKRRRQLQAKRIAHGHKPDDHEEYQGPNLSM